MACSGALVVASASVSGIGCSQILGIQDVPIPAQDDGGTADGSLTDAANADSPSGSDVDPFCVVGVAKVGCIVK
jgi:hypothetical protein